VDPDPGGQKTRVAGGSALRTKVSVRLRMHTSGCRVGIGSGSVAAMEEVMEIVSAEEMLCGPRNTASCNSTLLDEDSSRTGHNNWKLMVSRKSLTHEKHRNKINVQQWGKRS